MGPIFFYLFKKKFDKWIGVPPRGRVDDTAGAIF
jgi:hypothetical protein